jgi:hypothetical protein
MVELTEEAIAKMVADAHRNGQRMGADRMQKEIEARTQKLDRGTFYSPIDKVWKSATVPKSACKDSFRNICREDGYPLYQGIVDKVNAAKEERGVRSINVDAVAGAMQELSVKDDSGSNCKDNTKSKSKKSKKKRGSLSNNSSSSTIAGESNTSSIAGDGSARQSVSQEGSQDSNTSGLKNPDFAGNQPSSRAHCIPNSHCHYSYGVFCQAVCGVTVTLSEAEKLKDLSKRIMNSSTNILRAPGVHGELYDSKPCWILVPICTWKFMKNWKLTEGYSVMVIAGGWTAENGAVVSDENAYQAMCKNYYNPKDKDTTGTPKLSKCNEKDIKLATERLSDMVLALAETLVGMEGMLSPVVLQPLPPRAGLAPKGPDKRTDLLANALKSIDKDGIKLPSVLESFDFEDAQVLKSFIEPLATDLVPDPMLLLMKAAINWSWRCGQKLYPACGSVHSAVGEEEELEVPSTPIPSFIEVRAVPVTPDSDDDDELSL